MIHPLRTTLVLASLAFAASCKDAPTVCTSDLSVDIGYRDVLIGVGQRFTPETRIATCGGRYARPAAIDYTIADSTVLRVSDDREAVVGVATGMTIVSVADTAYGHLGNIVVTVHGVH